MSSVTFSVGVGGDGSTVTDDSNASTGLANGGHRTRMVPALAQVVAVAGHIVTKASDASTSATAAAESETLAANWASKTDATVDGSEFSAKEHAVGAQAGTGGSAKNWAQETGADVTGAAAGSRSAKSWAQDDLAGATYGGSAKDWAQSATSPDGAGKSAKSHADDAAASRAQMLYIIQGAFDPGTPPTVRDDGSAIQDGDYAFFTDNLFRRYNGATWVASDINTANLAASSGSSLVGFLASGASAAARTVQAKLRDTVSAFDFMSAAQLADVQGYTALVDVSAAVQAAINALPSRGGTVILPPGRYQLGSGITIDKNGSVALQGYGGMGYDTNATTQLYFTGAGACITIGNAASTVHNGKTLSRLYIEGNNSAGQIGVKVLRNNSNFFESVRVNEMLGAGSVGFQFDGTGDATIINKLVQCGVRKCTTGLKATKTTSLEINGGYWNAVGGTTGVDFIGDDTPLLVGVNFDSWTTAVNTRNAAATVRGVRITDCRFENNTTGIDVGPYVATSAFLANHFSLGGTGIGIKVDTATTVDLYLAGNKGHNITSGALISDPQDRAYGPDTRLSSAGALTAVGFAQIPVASLTTAVTGTGAASAGALVCSLDTGATAGSTALARTSANAGWSAGKNYDVINWSKRVIVSIRTSRASGGSVNGKTRFTLGKTGANTVGDLAGKGIGVTFLRGQPVAAVHDGTTLTTGNIESFNIDVATHDMVMISHGNGVVDFYLDGTYKTTLTGGPTGDSAGGSTVFQFEIENGADAIVNWYFLHDCRIWVEQ